MLGRPQQFGQQRPGGLGLGLAVAVLLDDRGVGTQRDVVHEEAAVDGGIVDLALDGVGEGAQRAAGIVPIEAEIEGEVVPGPRRHADERYPGRGRHRGHEGLRTVTPGHAEAVGPAGHRVLGQASQVVAAVEQHGLHPQVLSQLDQAELLDLAAARPRVAQQHRTLRRRGGVPRGPREPSGRPGLRRERTRSPRPVRPPEGPAGEVHVPLLHRRRPAPRRGMPRRRRPPGPPQRAPPRGRVTMRHPPATATTTPASPSSTHTPLRTRNQTARTTVATVATRAPSAASCGPREFTAGELPPEVAMPQDSTDLGRMPVRVGVPEGEDGWGPRSQARIHHLLRATPPPAGGPPTHRGRVRHRGCSPSDGRFLAASDHLPGADPDQTWRCPRTKRTCQVAVGSPLGAENLGFLGRELLIGENALVAEASQLLQLRDRIGRRLGRRLLVRLLGVLLLLLLRPAVRLPARDPVRHSRGRSGDRGRPGDTS